MKATEKKPYFTAKTVAALLAGDNHCHAAAWIKSRFWYAKRPSSFDFVQWQTQHDALVKRRMTELHECGYVVSLEGQNSFKLEGSSATLTGKPDLVSSHPNEVMVTDGKTGSQRATDYWQVLIYMACLPLARPELAKKRLCGEIVYSNGTIEITPAELTKERKALIFGKVRELSREHPFATTPSAQECGFCDISECTDRIEAETVRATSEF